MHRHSFTKLVMLLFFVVVSVIISLFLGMLLAIPIFEISFSDIIRVLNISTQSNILFMKYLQVVQAFGMFLIPTVLYAILYCFPESFWKYLKINRSISLKSAFYAAFAIVVALPMLNYFSELNSQLIDHFFGIENWFKAKEDEAQHLTEMFITAGNISTLLINLLVIAVLPAISEELMFRGVVQRLFGEWTKNAHLGILISAILFSAFHFQFYGFIPRVLLGLFLGYLVYFSGSLWLAVWAHFVNNGFAVISYYIYGSDAIEQTVDKLGTTSETVVYAVISAIFSFLAIFLIIRTERQRNLA